MRLIDADKLYDWVRRECNPYGKPTIDFESGNRMLDMIKRSSTAFDKEKVIGELKELKMIYFLTIANTGDEKMDFAYEVAGNAIDKAVEIIEKGGIE